MNKKGVTLMMGRPTKYTKEMQEKADEYLATYHKDSVVPSVASLSLYLDLSDSTIYDWKAKHPNFSRTLRNIKKKQEAELLNKGLTSEFNPTIVKLMLHNHGYSDKVEQDLKSSDGSMKPTVIELVAKGD
ncbi:MAG: terminase small subunit [Candidatus Thioglobus sp.]